MQALLFFLSLLDGKILVEDLVKLASEIEDAEEAAEEAANEPTKPWDCLFFCVLAHFHDSYFCLLESKIHIVWLKIYPNKFLDTFFFLLSTLLVSSRTAFLYELIWEHMVFCLVYSWTS